MPGVNSINNSLEEDLVISGLPQEFIFSSTAGVATGLGAGDTTLFTVPSGKTLIITQTVVRNNSGTNVMASFRVGVVISAIFQPISPIVTIGALTTNTLFTPILSQDGAIIASSGDVVIARPISTAGLASSVTVDLRGYYL